MMRGTRVHYEIYPSGFLPVAAVSAGGDCKWFDSYDSFDTVLAHSGEEIVGLLSFTQSLSGLVIVHVIWVRGDRRRCGIGKRMLHLLAPGRLRTEVISDDGLAFFTAARSRCEVRISDARQLAFWPFGQ